MTMRSEQALVQAYRSGDAAEREVAFRELLDHKERALRESLAPPGAIPNIAPLLEQRRFEYLIPNGALKIQAAFDICMVWQVPRSTQKYGDTSIIMPQTAKRRVEEESPRGILVTAGLKALDCLRSNGIDLGHMVTLIRQAPWRMPCDMVAGIEVPILLLRAGDITGSEDLNQALRDGRCRIEFNKETREHIFVDEDGQQWQPQLPFLPADY